MQKQQVSTQARYFPKRNWVPAVNIHFHCTPRLVPGSCCGNSFYTFCPCPRLLACEWRHRWWQGCSGSGSVSRAWAAGTGCGATAQQCHAGPSCSCPDAPGRASASWCRIHRALVNPPRGGDFLRGQRKGLSVGKTEAASVYPFG